MNVVAIRVVVPPLLDVLVGIAIFIIAASRAV